MSFKNKTLVITGAGQGIGFEIAKQLSNQGANVILNDLDSQIGQKAADSLNNCKFLGGDAGDLNIIKNMIKLASDTFGSVDFIIPNAGITSFGPFLNYTKEQLDKLLHVNIQGTFFLAQQGAKQLIRQNTGGRIILISSITSLKPHDELEAYGMTKAAITFLASALSKQMGPYGITVNCITPGATATERTMDNPQYQNGWAKIIPTRKVAQPSDIASAVLFLLSDGASHVNGQNLIIDGGWNQVGPMPDNI
ncbi:MAG: glucose 1-dehydrogenase [Algoriphagus sp.]